jgi:hypothetical protein
MGLVLLSVTLPEIFVCEKEIEMKKKNIIEEYLIALDITYH